MTGCNSGKCLSQLGIFLFILNRILKCSFGRDVFVDSSFMPFDSSDGSEAKPFLNLYQGFNYIDSNPAENYRIIVKVASNSAPPHIFNFKWTQKSNFVENLSNDSTISFNIRFETGSELNIYSNKNLSMKNVNVFSADYPLTTAPIKCFDGCSLELRNSITSWGSRALIASNGAVNVSLVNIIIAVNFSPSQGPTLLFENSKYIALRNLSIEGSNLDSANPIIFANGNDLIEVLDNKYLNNTLKSSILLKFLNTKCASFIRINIKSNFLDNDSVLLYFKNDENVIGTSSSLSSLKVEGNKAIFSRLDNYLGSRDSYNCLLKFSNIIPKIEMVLFSNNYLIKSLIDIDIGIEIFANETLSLTNSLFLNNTAKSHINLNNIYEILISDLRVENSNKYVPEEILILNDIFGYSLRISNNHITSLSNITITSSCAVNTAPGIAYISSQKSKALYIMGFYCAHNKAFIPSDEPKYYGVCLFISLQTNVHLSNSIFISNENKNSIGNQLGGNTCINYQTGGNSLLNITNSIFKSNRAFVESVCIKFNGENFSMIDSLLEDNKFSGDEYNILNDAGALHLGSEFISIVSTSLINNSAFSGAAIKLQNKLSKLSQQVYFCNVTIKNNIGDSAAAIEFHSSILSIHFLMKNSLITGNSVSLHAVVSIFYNGVGSDLIKFENVTVEKNSGKGIGACFFFPVLLGTVYFERSVFKNNALMGSPFLGGTVFLIWGGNKLVIQSFSCEFIENYCVARAGVVLCQYGKYYDLNSQFKNNFAPFSSSISIEVTGVSALTNCSITGKAAYHTGAFYISNSAKITINSTKFFNCQAELGGGVLSAYGSRIQLTILNCKFYNNKGKTDAAVLDTSLSLDRSIIIQNCELVGNSGGRSLIVASDLTINLLFVSIINNFASVIEARGSLISILNTTIENCTSQNIKRSLLTVTSQAQLIINNCIISNSKILSPPVFYLEQAVFLFQNGVLRDFIQNTDGSTLLYSDNSEIQFYSSSITRVTMRFMNLWVGALTFKNCIISEIMSFNTASIKLKDIAQVLIINSNFLNIISNDLGGAFSIINSGISKDQRVILNNSNFQNCTANSGGALYSHNCNVTLTNSTFRSNAATEFGGALHLSCQSDFKCIWNITNSLFKQNKANFGGGGIKYTGSIPDYIGNTFFEDNTAEFGKDYLSFPIKVRFQKLLNLPDESSGFEDSVDCEKRQETCKFTQQVSGSLLDPFCLEIRDTYGQLYHESSLSGEAEILMDSNITGTPAYIEGETLIQSKGGILKFTTLVPFVKPGTSIRLGISLNIPYDKRFLVLGNQYLIKNGSNNIKFILEAEFRSCNQGEIEVVTMNLCYKCPIGYFSLDIKDNICHSCIDDAKCKGGSIIEVNPGYWRASVNATRIYRCKSQMDSCKGGYDNTCLNGYEGIFCSECKGGNDEDGKKDIFFKKSMFKCESCDKWPLYFSILAIIFVTFETSIIWMNYKQSTKVTQSKISKILSTHIQFIVHTTSQGVEMPKPNQIFSSSISESFSSEGLFNFLSCLQTYIPLSKYLLNLIITLFSTILLTLFPIIVWRVLGKVKNLPPNTVKIKSINTLVVIFYFLHSGYVNFFITNIRCKEYEGQLYLVNNLGQKCWDSHHLLFSLIITLPMLLIWMLLFPGLIFYRIFKTFHQENQNQTLFSQIVTYFEAGYRKEKKYWEFIILGEKYVLIIIPLFLDKNTTPVLVLYTCLLLFYLVIHVENKPYMTRAINKLQALSFYSCFISYVSSITSQISNAENLRKLVSVLFFFFNISFFIYWLWLYYLIILKGKLLNFLSNLRGKGAKAKNSPQSHSRVVHKWQPKDSIPH